MRAIVVGGGIGGLSAAIGLRRRGWQVTVLERAPRFGAVGAGIVLQTNGLRGLDALGLGDAVRAAGRVDASSGVRTATGKWISRVDGEAVEALLGTPAVGIHRATLHTILRDALPAGALRGDAQVLDVTPGTRPVVRYRHAGDEIEEPADLVVGADGIDSVIRARLFPGHPGPAYSGSTAWRGVTRQRWDGELATALSWAPGTEFGMVPLGDGRVYWWCAVTAPEGERAADGTELTTVRRIVDGWHDPIRALLDATDDDAVIRTDLRHLATPLSSYADGAVALLGDAAHAMTPFLGQGACQAIEDAVVLAAVCPPDADVPATLADYDRQRRPRTQRLVRASYQIGRVGQQLRNPFAVRLRNGIMSLMPARAALRSMARYADWTPPVVPD